MIQKLKYNVVEQQVGKWGLIILTTSATLFCRFFRVTSVVQAVIKRYLHQKKSLVKGLRACKLLQPDLI